ncbi:hypothetical protein [Haloglomus litoreum]|uniref:hypothetical protein n=1 Tax=Haloglomus litoreum TaxID=3034026 RepID=UPI0023E7C6B8|nr:hypothetical protein [Haloglomus sp. DT116]
MSRYLTWLLLGTLVVCAGCSGLLGGADPGTETVRYGVAVESDYPVSERFGVRVKESGFDGEVVFNRSRELDAGERWHVANLSRARYRNGSYALQFTVEGEVVESKGLVYQSGNPDVGAVTKATLHEAGPSSSGTTTCEGSVTCYRERE